MGGSACAGGINGYLERVMTWSSMVWKDIFTNPPTETEDAGFHLSLHTDAMPTSANELDPSMHSGYARVKGIQNVFGARAGSPALSSVEWLGAMTGRRLTNDAAWSGGFRNRGGAAWPAVKSVAANCGPDANIPRSAVSYRVATITLGQDWILAAGDSGLPPDNLRDLSIPKPSPFSAGGAYGDLIRASALPNLNSYSLSLLLRGAPYIKTGQSQSRFDTPSERAAYGEGIAQMHYLLLLMNDSHFPESNGLKTGAAITGVVPGLPMQDHLGMWPIMALSEDGTKIENKNELKVNATSPITSADYWGLFNTSSSTGLGGTTYWITRRDDVPFPRRSSTSLLRYTSIYPTLEFYGPIDSASPALGVGQGVIPAGAISITL